MAENEKTVFPSDTLLMPQPELINYINIELPEYEWEEIMKHNQPRDLWIVVGGNIYNVGEFMFHHPGGAEIFLKNHGRDATDEFLKVGHPSYAMALTASFLIGKLKPGSKPPPVAAPIAEPAPAKCPFPHHLLKDLPDAAEIKKAAEQFYNATSGHETVGEQVEKEIQKPVETKPVEPKPVEQPEQPEPSTIDFADGLVEIPVAIPELKLDGERFLNFDILNNGLSQLDYYKRYGHIYQVKLPKNKGRIVVVSDPELLDEVAGDNEQFGKKVEGINFFKQLGGARGMGISVVSDSPFYDKVRRVMLPWYSPQHQRTQFSRMMDVAKDTIGAWEKIELDKPMDMRDWFTRYSLEISGRGACSYDFKLLDPNPQRSDFARAVPEALKEAVARVAEADPDKKPLFGGDKELQKRSELFHQQRKILFDAASQIVNNRINVCPVGQQTDLLTRLLTEADPESGEKLDIDTIRDQVLMHLSNGFNGPSVTMAWIAYVLATHKDIEQKVIDEIDMITGGDPDYELQYADLMNMKYITQVIKETLRVYPPMPVTIRNSLKNGRLGKYRMYKDDIIFVGSLAAQRDPKHWGEKAHEYDPENFALDKVVSRHRHAFIPFSVGIRQCMAQEVSFMMLRVGVFNIWNKYRLSLAPGAKVVQRAVVTMGPVTVPIVRQLRESKEKRMAKIAAARAAAKKAMPKAADEESDTSWDVPCELPADSTYKNPVVAFGSNFGSSKGIAERMFDKSKQFGFEPEIIPLNAVVDMPVKTKPWLLIVATATYTSNPPSNANKFKAWIDKQDPNCETWKNCRYIVWGLGNSQWNAFLHFPKYVYRRLGELGATPVYDFAAGDVSSPVWEEGFKKWSNKVWPAVINLTGAIPSEAAAAALEEQHKKEQELKTMDSASALIHSLAGKIVAPTLLTNGAGIETIASTVLVSRELHSPDAPTSTRHIEVSIPEGFKYTPGDHLGVCPKNDPKLVEKLADLLEAPLDAIFSVPAEMRIRAVPRGVPLQVRNVLTSLVDISAAPSLQLIKAMYDCSEMQDEKETLKQIMDVLSDPEKSGNSPLYVQLKSGRYNAVTLLDRFRGSGLNFFSFLELCQPLKPRYYSTSSSPEIHGDNCVHVSVGKLVTPVSGEDDMNFHGVSSNYIHSLKEGDPINIFLDAAEGFHIQDDVSKPMIMVSAGTGYAPMRAFLFERLAMKNKAVTTGPSVLYNGIRKSTHDYIYEDEIKMFVKEGVLDHLHIAMSRESKDKREYVQHKILENAQLTWELLQQGAYVYVCGSQAMRNDVQKAFTQVAQEQGGMSPEAAAAYMQDMEEKEKRYRPDVWG